MNETLKELKDKLKTERSEVAKKIIKAKIKKLEDGKAIYKGID